MRAATKNDLSSAQATCTASRLEASGHAAQVQSSTEPHTTPAPAFSKYRRNGNTERVGFIAAPNWFWPSAHFVNDLFLSGCCRFPRCLTRALQTATSDVWPPLLHESVVMRAVSPALARVQNSRVRALYSREIALASLRTEARGHAPHVSDWFITYTDAQRLIGSALQCPGVNVSQCYIAAEQCCTYFTGNT